MTTAVLLLVVVSLGGSAALSVTVTPEWEYLSGEETPLTVRYVADEPITHCQFRVAEYGDNLRPAVDLSLGHLSNVSHFTYEGDGLLAGHCGAIIGPEALPYWIAEYGSVQCRVRGTGSDWVYATMSVYRGTKTKIPLTIKSRLVVVRPGGQVNLLLQTEEPLKNCNVRQPQLGGWNHLHWMQTCGNEADSLCYHGSGISEGQCGATIKNITDRLNGMFWFELKTLSSLSRQRTHVQVVVTKPPSKPVLSANTTVDADGISTLKAVCTVAVSRPAANITWVLGGEVVTCGKTIYLLNDTWVKQYEEQTTVQQMTLIINNAMHGKDLWCIADHVALALPIISNKVKMI